MRKLMVCMTLILLVVGLSVAMPATADAKSACDVAAGYGWHSDFHNFQCYVEIMMDNWMLRNSAPLELPLPATAPTADIDATIALGTFGGHSVDTESGYAVAIVHLLL